MLILENGLLQQACDSPNIVTEEKDTPSHQITEAQVVDFMEDESSEFHQLIKEFQWKILLRDGELVLQ